MDAARQMNQIKICRLLMKRFIKNKFFQEEKVWHRYTLNCQKLYGVYNMVCSKLNKRYSLSDRSRLLEGNSSQEEGKTTWNSQALQAKSWTRVLVRMKVGDQHDASTDRNQEFKHDTVHLTTAGLWLALHFRCELTDLSKWGCVLERQRFWGDNKTPPEHG